MGGESDPFSPDYSPDYTGAGGDYGHGRVFGADTAKLYLAGVEHLPNVAGTYSSAASDVHWIHSRLDDIAGRLSHVGLWGTASQAERIYDALRVSSN